jgi:hypothetical protein
MRERCLVVTYEAVVPLSDYDMPAELLADDASGADVWTWFQDNRIDIVGDAGITQTDHWVGDVTFEDPA